MKIIGIIAEFNPFHNGHAYCIKEAKEMTGADYVIVVMSGDYVQRGEPAIMDKYIRTKTALHNGADLVFELPTALASGSAQYFARGAVSLLHHLGCVNHIVFGSESGNLEFLSAGNPTTPNDILGAEYLKALQFFQSSITPVLLKRLGTDYHDPENAVDTEYGKICSATYLRQKLFTSSDISMLAPEDSVKDYLSYADKNHYLSFDSISDLLFYKLNELQGEGYAKFFDVYEDLSCKIALNLEQYVSACEFRFLLKSKDIAFSHISRALLHILLNITKEDIANLQELDYCPFLRILGFRKDRIQLLGIIKESCSRPLISKLADAASYLSPEALSILKKDISASHLYRRLSQKNAACIQNEYRRSIIIV